MEVLERLKKSLIPWPPNFINIVRANPDLYVSHHLFCLEINNFRYGPFWITTTVVFLMGAAGN